MLLDLAILVSVEEEQPHTPTTVQRINHTIHPSRSTGLRCATVTSKAGKSVMDTARGKQTSKNKFRVHEGPPPSQQGSHPHRTHTNSNTTIIRYHHTTSNKTTIVLMKLMGSPPSVSSPWEGRTAP